MSQLLLCDTHQGFSKNTGELLATFYFTLLTQTIKSLDNQAPHRKFDIIRRFCQSQL
jgi:hypothetical protein